MIKLTICGKDVFATQSQIEALNALLLNMVSGKECREHDNWEVVPDPKAKRYQIVTETTVKVRSV